MTCCRRSEPGEVRGGRASRDNPTPAPSRIAPGRSFAFGHPEHGSGTDEPFLAREQRVRGALDRALDAVEAAHANVLMGRCAFPDDARDLAVEQRDRIAIRVSGGPLLVPLLGDDLAGL